MTGTEDFQHIFSVPLCISMTWQTRCWGHHHAHHRTDTIHVKYYAKVYDVVKLSKYGYSYDTDYK